jgi:uncharacterized protein (TIGR02757 family)
LRTKATVSLSPAGKVRLRGTLEEIYRKFNRPEWISPDPLECVLPYRDPRDREIAALVASGLAYGRVRQILKSVRSVLDRLGESPRDTIEKSSRSRLERDFSSFRHRFTTGTDLVNLIWGARGLCLMYGGLESAFLAGATPGENEVCALEAFLEKMTEASGSTVRNSLICRPADGSACKRHWLFLKWMVRSDSVDPGGWSRCDPARLVIPLDTHMHRIGLALGFTNRKAADLKSALEVTRSFAEIVPDDPTRYDFVLTRFGIREDLRLEDLLEKCRAAALDIHSTEDGHSREEKKR